MRDQLLVPGAVQAHFAKGQAPPQPQHDRFRQQIGRCRLFQEVDIEVGRDRHLHTPQRRQNGGVHGRIRQRHLHGAGQGAARSHQLALKRNTHPRPALAHGLDGKVDVFRHRHTGPNQLLHILRL